MKRDDVHSESFKCQGRAPTHREGEKSMAGPAKADGCAQISGLHEVSGSRTTWKGGDYVLKSRGETTPKKGEAAGQNFPV